MTSLDYNMGTVVTATTLTTVGGIAAAFVTGPCMDRLGAYVTLGTVYVVGFAFVALTGVAFTAPLWVLLTANFFAGGLHQRWTEEPHRAVRGVLSDTDAVHRGWMGVGCWPPRRHRRADRGRSGTRHGLVRQCSLLRNVSPHARRRSCGLPPRPLGPKRQSPRSQVGRKSFARPQVVWIGNTGRVISRPAISSWVGYHDRGAQATRCHPAWAMSPPFVISRPSSPRPSSPNRGRAVPWIPRTFWAETQRPGLGVEPRISRSPPHPKGEDLQTVRPPGLDGTRRCSRPSTARVLVGHRKSTRRQPFEKVESADELHGTRSSSSQMSTQFRSRDASQA